MSLLHYRRVERRRTSRATMCINVLVYGQNESGEKFRYWTRSLSVSGFGGVVLLEEELAVGQTLQVMNEYNGRKARAKIVAVRSTKDGQVQASFEFVEGGEKFWSMTFPPANAKPLRRLLPRPAEGD
jgi:c-di-GMP-binding flagellar brake protein YcgR